MRIYLHSVGNNCSLLLNVPPDKNGLLSNREQRTLRRFKRQIDAAFRTPLQPSLALLSADGTATDAQGLLHGETVLFPAGAFVLRLSFDCAQPVRTLALGEDTAYSQRVERFSVWAEDADGEVRKQKCATVIGHKKILRFSRPVRTKTLYVVIEQARDVPALCLCGVWR